MHAGGLGNLAPQPSQKNTTGELEEPLNQSS